MVHEIVQFLIVSFQKLSAEVFDPLISYFELSSIIVGFFITFISYRFIFFPLLNGSSGFGKLFHSGSDRARKKEE